MKFGNNEKVKLLIKRQTICTWKCIFLIVEFFFLFTTYKLEGFLSKSQNYVQTKIYEAYWLAT